MAIFLAIRIAHGGISRIKYLSKLSKRKQKQNVNFRHLGLKMLLCRAIKDYLNESGATNDVMDF